MKVVSPFEGRLLRILHAFLHRAPVEPVRPLLIEACPRPRCLSRAAVELVQDALAKGCVQLLSKQGGWRRERYLRGERAVEGRLWERTAPAELELKFSRHALGFLMWVTAEEIERPKEPWRPPAAKLTSADHLLHYLAFEALVPAKLARHLVRSPAFQGNPLCRLAYPEEFIKTQEGMLPDFAAWTMGPGAYILEVLQKQLAQRQEAVERDKGGVDNWQYLQSLGRAQERVLEAFLLAAEQAGRRDLARFLLAAGAELLIEGVQAERWLGGLTNTGPRLADRSETHRAALVFSYLLRRMRAWTGQARAVGYVDEGYQASQLWLADWERYDGDALCRRAEAVIQQLDPMKQTSGD